MIWCPKMHHVQFGIGISLSHRMVMKFASGDNRIDFKLFGSSFFLVFARQFKSFEARALPIRQLWFVLMFAWGQRVDLSASLNKFIVQVLQICSFQHSCCSATRKLCGILHGQVSTFEKNPCHDLGFTFHYMMFPQTKMWWCDFFGLLVPVIKCFNW